MYKFTILAMVFLMSYNPLLAQQKVSLYNPKANARMQLDSVLLLANTTHKNVLVQVGGNWCSWCIKLHYFIERSSALKRLMTTNFVTYKLNYSTDNRNQEVLKAYKNATKVGFPVLLVLNDKGELLHLQETGIFEQNGSYNASKLTAFFKQWKRKD